MTMRSPRRLERALPFMMLAALLLLPLLGCGGADSPPARGDGPLTIRVLMSHDPPNLSLIGKIDRNSAILAAQITDSLLQYDESMELQPRLARDWEFS